MKQLNGMTIAAITVLMGLAGCSTTSETGEQDKAWRTDARLGEQVDRICFRSSIDNFRAPTRNTVIVEKGVNDEYLIETMGRCHDLSHAQSLSFDTFPGAGCVSRGDSIYAFDSVFGPDRTDIPSVRCPIAAIYEWDEDAAEAASEVETEE
jgi:hypothetical protein